MKSIAICAVFVLRFSFQANGQSGIINTVDGNGYPGFSGDGGSATSASITAVSVAVDASGNVFFGTSNGVREVSLAGIITSVVGDGKYDGSFADGIPAVSAQISFANGVAVDATGNLFVTDRANNRVRKVSSGIITTVAGNGQGGFSGDGGPATSASLLVPLGIAVDTSGNLFIADAGNNRIRMVSSSGIITTVTGSGYGGGGCPHSNLGDGGPATAACLGLPTGVFVDSMGNLFIADSENSLIRKVSAGTISTVAGRFGNLACGYGDPAGDGGPATLATLCSPSGVAVGSTGDIFIAELGGNRLRKVSASGLITTIAGTGKAGFSGDGGPAVSAMLNEPQSVTIDSSGNLFFVDEINYRIRKVSADTVAPVVSSFTMIDPVPQLLFGPQITAAATLANAASGQPYLADLAKGRMVNGIATDGVAQVVLRIPASSIGQQFTVDILPNQCSSPIYTVCTDEYGFLFDPTKPPGTLLFSNSLLPSPIIVNAVATAGGPMAFVAYRAPLDFVRSEANNAADQDASQRSVFIAINGLVAAKSITLVRPPVVLIHGTFSDPSMFNNFSPLQPFTVAPNPRFFITTLDYSLDIDSQVSSTFPSYTKTRAIPFQTKTHIKQNVIGVAYNSPLLLKDMVANKLTTFKTDSPAPINIPIAAVQADVIAHSLGGLIARGMTYVGTIFVGMPMFYGDQSYGRGYIHKLITLGTPHLGTNLALRTVNGDRVLGDPTVGNLFPKVGGNDCTRNTAAWTGAYSLNWATINGAFYPGAALDQLGDPTQGIVSPTIALLNLPHLLTIPTAFIAAYFTTANYDAQIDRYGHITQALCGSTTEFIPPDEDPYFVPGVQSCGNTPCLVIPGDFLADNYSFANWPNIFNTQSSDVIVPFTSARFGQAVYSAFPNVVHGPGTVGAGSYTDPHIGFAGPQLLDPASLVPAMVLQLLNASVKDTLSFVNIP